MTEKNGFGNDDDMSMEEFEAALEESFITGEVEQGDKVTGRIVAMDDQYAFMDIGAKSEGVLQIEELVDEEGNLIAGNGDELPVTVVRTGDEIILSYRMRKRDQSLEMLKQAYETGLPVQGRVAELKKGGFSIDLGGSRAFCPISKIDILYVESPADYLETTFSFRIIKFDRGGRDIVVDRAGILREDARKNAEAALAELEPGVETFGKVTKLMDFGAFVSLGAVEGLVHISEISWDRLENPAEVLTVGQTVKVRVLGIEDGGKRISLSIRQAEGDPWDRYVGMEINEGAVMTGTVMRLEKYGAFVRLKPGLEGLVHISEMSWEKRVRHPSDLLGVGDEIRVKILGIDSDRRRIALGIKQLEVDPWESGARSLAAGQPFTGTIQTVKSAGLEVLLPQGITAFMPKSLTGDSRDPLAKRFSEGAVVSGEIAEIDTGNRRCILRMGDASDGDADYREYLDRPDQDSPGSGFGSLGKLLSAAMKRKKDSDSR